MSDVTQAVSVSVSPLHPCSLRESSSCMGIMEDYDEIPKQAADNSETESFTIVTGSPGTLGSFVFVELSDTKPPQDDKCVTETLESGQESDPENYVDKGSVGFYVASQSEILKEIQKEKTSYEIRQQIFKDVELQVNGQMTKMEIYLPEYIISFFKQHKYALNRDMQIKNGRDGKEFLQITSSDAFHGGKKFVSELLSPFLSCRMPMDNARLSYLDHAQGCDIMEEIEQKNMCAIRTQASSVLLRGVSPQDHQVCVYEGSIARSDCRLLILPLHAEQREWSPEIRQMLRKEYLYVDVDRYFKTVGPPPKCRSMVLRYPKSALHSLIVIYMSSHIETTVNLQTLTEVLSYAEKDDANTIAIPYDLLGGSREQVLKDLLHRIDTMFSRDCPALTLKLYTRNPVLCKEINRALDSRGWTSSGPCDFRRDRSIKIQVGDILKCEADAIVCSSHESLNLTLGQFSRVLLEAAGPGLAQQCSQLYPYGLTYNAVAITDSFGLSNTLGKIFHILLPPWTGKTEKTLYPPLEWLRSRVQACLALASALGYESILFPTLGIGTLRYPAREVAETMFSTFREFFTEMPQSSLCDVTVVCFPKNVPEYQDFKVVDTRFASQQSADCISDTVLEMTGVQLHIIRGRADQLCDTADFALMENWEGARYDVWDVKLQRLFHIRMESNREKENFHQILSTLEQYRKSLFSLQINMCTFRSYQGVVAGLESCLSEARSLKVVTLVVASAEDVSAVRAMFAKARVNPRFSVPAAGAVREETMGRLTVFGKVYYLDKAIEEVMKLQVPKEFQAQKAVSKTKKDAKSSSVDGPEIWPRRGDGVGQRRTDRKVEVLETFSVEQV